MKKIPITLIFAMALMMGRAQDYRLMADTAYSLFDNGEDLRAIRVDSTTIEGLSVIQHLSPTIQNIDPDLPGCFTPWGPSWMGPKIRLSADGTQLLFNLHGDTIRILAQRNIGQPWTAYQSPDLIIVSSVTFKTQFTVLGQVDSLKFIDFQAFNGDMVEINHPVNDLTVRVSKHYGVIGTLNFYAFPEYMEEYYERPLEAYTLVGREGHAGGAQNLTWQDVFDFQPGDELHVVEGSESFGVGWKRNTILHYLTRAASGDNITYTVKRSFDAYSRDGGDWTYDYSSVDTVETVITPFPEFDQWPMLPTVVDSDFGWLANYYRQKSDGPVRKTTRQGGTMIFPEDNDPDECWLALIDAGCPDGSSDEYLKGKGGPYYDCTISAPQHYWRELVYSYVGGVEEGTPLELILGTDDHRSFDAGVYPNPASDRLTLDLPTEILPADLRLTDVRGRTVQNGVITGPTTDIDVSALPGGIYLYTISSRSGQTVTGKIAIER